MRRRSDPERDRLALERWREASRWAAAHFGDRFRILNHHYGHDPARGPIVYEARLDYAVKARATLAYVEWTLEVGFRVVNPG